MRTLINHCRTLLCLALITIPVTGVADMAMGNISFAWIYKPIEAPENLPTQYFHNTLGSSVQFKRDSEGSYKVAFNRSGKGSQGGGNVQVTAYFSQHYCKVASWTPSFRSPICNRWKTSSPARSCRSARLPSFYSYSLRWR